MNSVHLVTREKYSQKNRVENQAGCTSTQLAQLARPGAHRSAQPATPRARLSSASALRHPARLSSACTPCPAPVRPTQHLRAQPSACALCRCYSGRIVAWLGTVLQYSPALPSPLLTIQLYCIAIQFELAYAAIHLSPITVLQYSFLANTYLAIQSHNTVWAVAQLNFSAQKFFRFFFHYKYFCFHYF